MPFIRRGRKRKLNWWEEKTDDGIKWRTLEHKGMLLAPPYELLPGHVRFYYDGKEMRLSEDAEEITAFYAKMPDHGYTTKEVFNKNFFTDWRKVMTERGREITRLKKRGARRPEDPSRSCVQWRPPDSLKKRALMGSRQTKSWPLFGWGECQS